MGRWAEKRAKQKTKKLKDQVYERLEPMHQEGRGRSKAEDKKNGISSRYIYSSTTYQTYKKESKNFCDFLQKEHPEVKNLDEGQQYVNEWLQSLIDQDFSPWSISTKKAALTKLYQVPAGTFMETPARERAKIKRSRYDVVGDRHISEQTEKKFAKLTSATGLRRAELTKITGDALFQEGGRWYLKVTKGTKGGRSRTVEILGKDETETMEIVQLFQEKGKLKVCPKLPKHYDNHHFRSVYANRIYSKYARPLQFIPKDKRYWMRKERAGQCLDRDAMLITSENLGHSRIDVIAQSYLY